MAEKTENELYDAVRSSLQASGKLSKMKAEMTCNVMESLNWQGDGAVQEPGIINLVNNLICEYFDWNTYLLAGAAFRTEVYGKQEQVKRSDLAARLGLEEDKKSASLPLLLAIVLTFQERLKRDKESDKKEEITK